MTSVSNNQTRTYDRAKCIVFLKTNEAFGGLSNMAGGYPLIVNGVRILTSEALYQVCRFPLLPDVQRLIIEQKSPMSAKMKSKPHRKDSRPDWDQVRVNIMRWCLRVKLAQNWNTFSKLLLDTGEKPIVEHSRKDDFWGAKPVDNQTLVGRNILGRLLMELREEIKRNEKDSLLQVQPVSIQDFLLYGRPIQKIIAKSCNVQIQVPKQPEVEKPPIAISNADLQATLFDSVPVKEVPSTYITARQTEASLLSDLKPYAEYKATEKEWFGVVPKHWDVLPNRSLFSEVKDRNHPDEEMLSVTIKRGVVRQKTLLADSSKKDSSNLNKSAYKLVQPADIAYNKMRTWQGAIGVSEFRGIISPAYIVMRLRNKENTPRYFHHLYRTPQFAKEAERWSYGITSDMWSLRPEHFKVIYTPQPSREEQDAIVRFLNWANIRLEKAIRAKRKVIALLNEQKQAISHRAVTRGLDPSVPLKPSGIPWIGEIPQHWETKRLKAISQIRYGLGQPPRETDHGVPLIRATNIDRGRILKKNLLLVDPKDVPKTRNAFLKAGEIIVVRSGALTADSAIIPLEYEGAVAGYDMVVSVRKAQPEFVAMAILSSYIQKDQLVIASMRAAQPHLNVEELGVAVIILPPDKEQAQIVEYVRIESLPIDTNINNLEHEIDLLREYRIRLVADVVTGKLDVREVAAKLPEEEMPEEIEAGSEDEISEEEIAV